jgi:large subunit ribosomal protein L15
MKLNEIADNAGARKIRKRVGRGLGSGLGKTAGRGGKGQTARKGGAKAGFEGGQMPIYRRLPKRGFNKPNQVSYNEVNLQTVQAAVDAKKLDIKAAVTAASLIAAGVISRPLGGVRLLAKGEIKSKLAFEVFYATKGAIAAVEKAGGSVKVLRPVEVPSEHKSKVAWVNGPPHIGSLLPKLKDTIWHRQLNNLRQT